MSEQEKQHCVKNHPTFGTGSLLLITTWASLCFTAIFVSQSLFLFQVSRLMGMSAVVMSAIVPLFLKLKNRKFWNAYSVAILVYLSYSFMHEYANPIVSEVAVDVCRLLRADGPYSPGIRGVDYFTGTIGTFTAIYFFLGNHSAF